MDANGHEFGIEQFQILPPGPGKCPICAEQHDAEFPHNAYSLYYQMKFRQANGRFPTWNDAMSHCTPEMREAFTEELAKRGIVIEDQS